MQDIIQDMHEQETRDAENLLKMLAPVKTISESIENIEKSQFDMNDRMLMIYENTKKIFSLAIGKATMYKTVIDLYPLVNRL